MQGYQYRFEERQTLLPWVGRPVPVPPRVDRVELQQLADRTRGMLLGVAIGDSLGNTSEGMTPAERSRLYGQIRYYLPHPREDMRCIGFPSDDTQLAFWTVESLLRRGFLDPADLADTFVGPRIFGLGKAVTDFVLAYRFDHKPWYEAGSPSAGNGALMRIAPVILPHLRDMTADLWSDAVAATIVTHRDEAAVVADAGFVGLLCECLAWSGDQSPPAHWWSETFLRYARPMETGRVYASRVLGDSFRGSLCDRVEQSVRPAVESGMTVLQAAELWNSGTYLLETVPCALHILARHGADAEEAIVRSVNDTRDNDTIAAVVGAAVGALHGLRNLPLPWQEGLLGRTVEDDDGRVQELVEKAVQAFVV